MATKKDGIDIEGKIAKLAEKLEGGREDHLKEVNELRKRVKAAMLKKNLREHPALTQLLGLLRKREESYSVVLSNKGDMPEEQRRRFFAKREECRFVLSFFESAEKSLAGAEQLVDYYLSDEVRDEAPPEEE